METQTQRHIQQIYCDESGFSGSNLFRDDQPFFVYATVATDDEAASPLVEEVVSDYRIDGNELKGSRLLRFNRGRKAITRVLGQYHDQMKVAVFHKKYTLATMFFEYIFEPVLARKSSVFYSLGFHKFVSTVLFLHFQARAAYAEQHLAEFQDFMRGELESPVHLFGSLQIAQMPDTLKSIRDFARHNEPAIREELNSLAGMGMQKWVLDVTTRALFSLLAEWGMEFEQLRVYCDSSKPLEADKDLFNAMISQQDRRFIRVEGELHPLTFNLAGPVEFVDSVEHAAIQVADVAAAAVAYVFRHPKDECAKAWKPFVLKCLSEYSVCPDYDHIDLGTPEAFFNGLLLEELAERSRQHADVLDGLEDFFVAADRAVSERFGRPVRYKPLSYEENLPNLES